MVNLNVFGNVKVDCFFKFSHLLSGNIYFTYFVMGGLLYQFRAKKTKTIEKKQETDEMDQLIQKKTKRQYF